VGNGGQSPDILELRRALLLKFNDAKFRESPFFSGIGKLDGMTADFAVLDEALIFY